MVTVAAHKSKAELPPPYAEDSDLHRMIARVDRPKEGDANDYWSKSGLNSEAWQHTDAAETEKVGKLRGLAWCYEVTKFADTDLGHMKGMLRELREGELELAVKMLCDKAPTLTNLRKASQATGSQIDDHCPLCKKYTPKGNNRSAHPTQDGQRKQTLCHVLNNCPFALDDGRYTKRHDSVLEMLAERLEVALKKEKVADANLSYTLWADIPRYHDPVQYPEHIPWMLRDQYRPDIMVTKKKAAKEELILIELTCPFESKQNLENAHKRKVDKYTPLVDALKAEQKYSQVHLRCIEVGSRGYAANTCQEIHQYLKCGRGHPRVNVFMRKVGKKCLQKSLEIFRKRDKALLYENADDDNNNYT